MNNPDFYINSIKVALTLLIQENKYKSKSEVKEHIKKLIANANIEEQIDLSFKTKEIVSYEGTPNLTTYEVQILDCLLFICAMTSITTQKRIKDVNGLCMCIMEDRPGVINLVI